MISAALQRRVWFGDGNESSIYPGAFYTLLIGGPGVGKSIIATQCGVPILKTFVSGYDRIRDQYGQEKIVPIYKIPFAADCSTFEAMIQYISKAQRNFLHKSTTEEKPRPYPHASLCVLLAEEMASLFRKNTEDISTLFRQCYDARNFHYATKHHGDFEIRNVCMSFLGCITFEEFAKMTRSGLIGTGLISRLLLVVAEHSRPDSAALFEATPVKKIILEEVRNWIGKIVELKGELTYSETARAFLLDWHKKKFNIQKEYRETRFNKEPVLDEYYARKNLHLQKLAVAIHFCRDLTMVIEEDDLRTALRELEKLELNMHKALISGGKNELAEVTQGVLKFLGRKPEGATRNEILIELWNNASAKLVDEGLTYLRDVSGQAVYDPEKRKYFLVKDNNGETTLYSDTPI
jgi:hypothetical protein